MNRNLYLTLCSLQLFAAVSLSQAAGDPATTEIRNVDSDYHWVGEYDSVSGGSKVALQISVRKGEKPLFAKLYQGGLPGIGWNASKPIEFEGTAGQKELLLQAMNGSTDSVRVSGGIATLVNSSGAKTEFRKVARRSVTMGLKPPAGSKILFDGSSTSAWKSALVTEDGLLKAGAETVDPIGGCRLHLEFRTPYMPASAGQKRGNSGVYLQRRYEVQILESFALEGVENECGAIYTQQRPNVNMALPPLVWQTYDIYFSPAKFDGEGNRSSPAEVSVIHNGVPVHYRTAIKSKTGAGRPESPDPLPLLLQDHGDPVVFRNVWLQSLDRLNPLPQSVASNPIFPPVNFVSGMARVERPN